MKLIIICRTEERASGIKNSILQEVVDGNIKTWNSKEVNINGCQKLCIYHDTDQTRNENKIAYFTIERLGVEVHCNMYPAIGTNMTDEVKLWILGRMSQMVIEKYIGKFITLYFEF